METNTDLLRSGGDEAIVAGCACAVLDNGHGKGIGGNGKKFGWWISEDCPIHGKPNVARIASSNAKRRGI